MTTPAQIEAVLTDVDTRMQGKSFAIMTAPEWLIISQAAALTATAEVGEHPIWGDMNELIDAAKDITKLATIERCAQVAETIIGCDYYTMGTIAAAIRKLKDE